MPRLLPAYKPAVFFSKQTIPFAAGGFNATNTEQILRIDSPIVSWVPLSPINALTGLEADMGYLIFPIADIILDDDVAQTGPCPPIPIISGAIDIQTIKTTTAGSETSLQFDELINRDVITFIRDLTAPTVILTGTPNGKQILFDKTTGTLTPAADNPFGVEDIQIVYKRLIAP